MKPKFRAKLKKWMKRKISFRMHMSIIMLSTIFCGVITNFIMLNTLGVSHPGLRFPLTVILSYCWFLTFVRLYIRNILLRTSRGSVLDFSDFTPNFEKGTGGDTLIWKGDGGSFSGGGSSGSWGCEDVATEVAKEAAKESASSSISSLVEDEGGVVVVLVLGGLVAVAVFGSGAYFIWHSPEILSECLIQVILVSGMRRQMKKFSEAEWISHMFQTTKWPFVIVLVFSLFLGLGLRAFCPEANNVRDYKDKCWKSY